MRKHVPVIVAVVATATFVLAGLWEPASADAKRFRAFVYPDRTQPEMSVVVEDFRVNETVWDIGGVQYLWVHGPAGNFKVPFKDVSQIEMVKFVGLTQVDWARYEVKVSETDADIVHFGTLDIRVMLGIADGEAWYFYPATHKDRGTRFCRIVLGDASVEPTIPCMAPPPAPPAEVPPPMAPPPPPMPPPVAEPEGPNEDELLDAFFDFDLYNIRPDAEDALARNAEFLKRWPNVVVRIDGYADERGTVDYNAGLGYERATAARDYLIGLGVPASRISVSSKGESEEFCPEATEACWQRNRRAHFVIIAK